MDGISYYFFLLWQDMRGNRHPLEYLFFNSGNSKGCGGLAVFGLEYSDKSFNENFMKSSKKSEKSFQTL